MRLPGWLPFPSGLRRLCSGPFFPVSARTPPPPLCSRRDAGGVRRLGRRADGPAAEAVAGAAALASRTRSPVLPSTFPSSFARPRCHFLQEDPPCLLSAAGGRACSGRNDNGDTRLRFGRGSEAGCGSVVPAGVNPLSCSLVPLSPLVLVSLSAGACASSGHQTCDTPRKKGASPPSSAFS